MFDHARVMQRNDKNPCKLQGRNLGELVTKFCIAIFVRLHIKGRAYPDRTLSLYQY